jgi:hypothetical protein
MKVYQLRLVLGKAANYDQTGKLKNQTITAKYVGEGELEQILEDRCWQKLGACEISCVNVFDSAEPSVSLPLEKQSINDRIKADIQAGTKPKTEIELLKEQIAALTEKVNEPKTVTSNDGKRTIIVDDNIAEEDVVTPRAELFAEAAELGLNPAKNIKTDILKDLIANAKKEKV